MAHSRHLPVWKAAMDLAVHSRLPTLPQKQIALPIFHF
jgi:hypothetical protein